MYSEKSFQNYIFWTKVKRVFVMILFSILGCLLGIFISDIINTITVNDSYRIVIISISTLLFFALSVLLTVGIAREVQDGYWKIAVLRKLTVISKKLDNLDNLKNLNEIFNQLELIEAHINRPLNKSLEENSQKDNQSPVEETPIEENDVLITKE